MFTYPLRCCVQVQVSKELKKLLDSPHGRGNNRGSDDIRVEVLLDVVLAQLVGGHQPLLVLLLNGHGAHLVCLVVKLFKTPNQTKPSFINIIFNSTLTPTSSGGKEILSSELALFGAQLSIWDFLFLLMKRKSS